MAQVLGVSESGYHKWVRRQLCVPSRRAIEDEQLLMDINNIYRSSKGSFGSRKIVKIINARKLKPINHKRIERIMHENYLFSKSSKKYHCTTDSKHKEVIADNLIDRNFDAASPNEKMVSDTTVISTKEGDLYVAGIIDLYARMPVGLAMSRHNDKELVIAALNDMLIRGCGSPGCIMHSDRGSTYASRDYRIQLSRHELLCSMSRKGDCWDNAPMECFWGKLKSEWLQANYQTIEAAARDVYEYVWHFYSRLRPHESLGYQTPLEYYCKVKNVSY